MNVQTYPLTYPCPCFHFSHTVYTTSPCARCCCEEDDDDDDDDDDDNVDDEMVFRFGFIYESWIG